MHDSWARDRNLELIIELFNITCTCTHVLHNTRTKQNKPSRMQVLWDQFICFRPAEGRLYSRLPDRCKSSGTKCYP